MKKVTITKALKVKNRLSGELNRIRDSISQGNSREESRHETEYIKGRIDKEQSVYNDLIEIKAGIQVATAPIAHKLVQLSEEKAKLAWLGKISTKEGTFDVGSRYDVAIQKTETYKVVWNTDNIRQKIEDTRNTIERLQDEIDEYNATTVVK